MLTKLTVRNFKRFSEVEIELGNPVVFVGPNNSGKTSAMQALALWEVGLRRWNERRSSKSTPERRPGVTVGRRDLVAVPVPHARLLWHGLAVRAQERAQGSRNTYHIYMDVIVEGVAGTGLWRCGLEFYYANEESFYCRPLRLGGGRAPQRMPIPPEAAAVRFAYLPPMSGLAATETRLDHGAVNVRVGEGRTAEVLRNLCYRVSEDQPTHWNKLVEHVESHFGATLKEPRYIVDRGEIEMKYVEAGVELDISSGGRGLQQTMLLLSYMYANPGAVVLLDEPDAHLETLRQRQTYQLITDAARDSNTQIIAASHSEVVLNEAAGTDSVVAFVGRPHRIDDRASQVLKSLNEIGFDHYLQAEQAGWVLYLEGSTDLAVLRSFARRLGHERAVEALQRPFVHYVGNKPQAARSHFHGLREAYPSLRGVALFDRLSIQRSDDDPLVHLVWKRREIENYLCSPEALSAYAGAFEPSSGPLEAYSRQHMMHEAIEQISSAMETLGRGSPWSGDAKVSDDFLTPLFDAYFKRLDLPNLMHKRNFHELAEHVPEDKIDSEVGEKLDAIVEVAEAAGSTAGA
ncbi:MAG: AAA family ATPase [Acidimicrobiaceae bacterium]|nr:AAA family ATPase [Acidimicrobiaceae bacterium]